MYYETFYTPNPDASAPMGLLEVPVAGREPAPRNLAYADLIRRAIEASQVEDPQALVMEIFYRGGDIPRELVPHVEETVQELDVASSVRGRLYELVETQPDTTPFTERQVQEMAPVFETDARQSIFYLTQDGLLADPEDSDFTAPLLQGDPSLELADERQAILAQLEAEEARRVEGSETNESLRPVTFTWQSELVWRPDENGTQQPIRLSEREHMALGFVAADGAFEHVVTILDPGDLPQQPIEDRLDDTKNDLDN